MEKRKKEENSVQRNDFGDVFKKSLQENVAVTPENNQPQKRKRKKSSLRLYQSRKKNEKYVNALMKENPQKYTQVYADKSSTSEVNERNEGNIRRRKWKLSCKKTLQDNDKSTQVFLCCGQEVKLGDQQCQCCSRKRVNVVESGTQADFVDVDGYVDERLQKQTLEFTQEKIGTHSNNCTGDVNSTPENESYDVTLTDSLSITNDEIMTNANVCENDNYSSSSNKKCPNVCSCDLKVFN